MNRLQTEFHRLYHPRPADAAGSGGGTAGLIDDTGCVRAVVLEVARPADWTLLARVWRGVQTDLGLAAPAIAASGTDGLQLWFSLSEPLGVAPAHAFLAALRCRYLPDVAPQRVSLMPAPDASSASGGHARAVPALNEATGNWSAFVAPDLAPIFAETPWLDLPPSDDGQAKLLCHLVSNPPAMLAAALKQLEPVADPIGASPASAAHDSAHDSARGAGLPSTRPVVGTGYADPRHFLLAVMNDEGVPLALRIDAAKALLPHVGDRSDDRIG
jgi:hypothetical protein